MNAPRGIKNVRYKKKLRDFDEQLKKEGPPRRSTLSFTAGVAFDGEKHQWSEIRAHRTRAKNFGMS